MRREHNIMDTLTAKELGKMGTYGVIPGGPEQIRLWEQWTELTMWFFESKGCNFPQVRQVPQVELAFYSGTEEIRDFIVR